MKHLLICTVAGITFATAPLAINASLGTAHAQSTTGEASSGGVAGGDSFGSAGSARGGNGPSATGIAASGGVAGGNPPGGRGVAPGGADPAMGVDSTVTGSVSPEISETEIEVESCGSSDPARGSCSGGGSSGD